jgi:hypothetical protein
MSLETAQKVIVPQKKNYVPQFLKQRDINSYKNPGRIPYLGLELTMHVLKSQVDLVRQSLSLNNYTPFACDEEMYLIY